MLFLAVSRYCGGESERILGRMADGQGQSKVSIATKANPWGEGGSQDQNYLHCIRTCISVYDWLVCYPFPVCMCVRACVWPQEHTHTDILTTHVVHARPKFSVDRRIIRLLWSSNQGKCSHLKQQPSNICNALLLN